MWYTRRIHFFFQNEEDDFEDIEREAFQARYESMTARMEAMANERSEVSHYSGLDIRIIKRKIITWRETAIQIPRVWAVDFLSFIMFQLHWNRDFAIFGFERK